MGTDRYNAQICDRVLEKVMLLNNSIFIRSSLNKELTCKYFISNE